MNISLKGLAQVALFCALALISNYIVELLHIPLPGSIVGIIILFCLLQFNILRMEWVELGANLLLAELLLFFIPSAVGIVKYKNLLLTDGLQILIVVILGTTIVMTSTGLAAQKIASARSKK